MAGFYTLKKPTEEKPLSYFTANLDTEESNLERIDPKELKERFPDFKFQFRGREEETLAKVDIKPPSSNLWKYLLYAVIGFLLLESICAWLFGRHKT